MFNIQGRKWARRGFLLLAGAFLSAVSGFYTPIASAASNSLELSGISVLSKSEGVEGTITKSGETDIEHSITFHKVGDSVDFSVKLTNKDAQKYVVESVAAENDNEFITYEIGDYAGTIIQENGEFVFSVHEVYAVQLDDLAQRAQAASVKFTIKFDEKVEEINVNPKTNDAIPMFISIAVVSILGLAFAVYMIRKNKKALGIVAVFVVAALIAVPVSIARADDEYVVISLIGEYSLEDRVLVTLSVDGEEQEVIVDYGDTLPEPEDPQIEGYTFKGWKTEDGEDYDFSQPVTEDIKLVAGYEANKYTIVFDGNGASGAMDNLAMVYDVEKQLPELGFKLDGYDFVTWNTKADGEGDCYADKEAVVNLATSGEVKLYAVWETRNDTKYTVNHLKRHLEGNGYDTADTDVSYGTTDKTVTPATRDYYGFIAPEVQSLKITGDGKAVLDYLYERDSFRLTLKDAEFIESDFATDDYVYETPITLNAKERLGYSFKQWSNGDEESTISFALTENTEIGPEYEANPYTIKFDGNKATSGEMGDEEAIYDQEFVLPRNDYKRTGYDFNGWNTKADGSGDAYSDIARVKNLVASGEVTLYAQWVAHKYTVIFNPGKATEGEMAVQELTYDTPANLTENAFTYPGFDFAGWNTDKNGSGDAYDDKAEVLNLATEGEVNLYAQWVARNDTPYTVVHKRMNLDGSTYTTYETEHLEGTTNTYVTPAVKEYEGFKKPTVQKKKITGNGKMKITYLYEREKRSFALIDEGAEVNEYSTMKFFYGTLIDLDAVERVGYTFKQWSNGLTEPHTNFELTEDTVLWPVYEANKYTIYFDANATKYVTGEMEPQVHTYDQKLALTENAFKRAGYDFVGWNTDKDGDGDAYDNKQEVKNLLSENNSSITFYAQWVARNDTPYTVYHKRMNLDGKTYTTVKTEHLKGTTDTMVTPATISYKHFISPATQTKNIEGDGSMEIEYLYERKKYELTLTNEEQISSEFKSGKYYYETLITLSVNKLLGYTFSQWTNGSTDTSISFKLVKNTKIGPEFKPNKYTVVFDKNLATDGKMDNYYTYYDESFKLPENKFKRVGYDYVGWNTKADGTGTPYKDMEEVKNLATAGTVTLYAQWKARTDTKYVVVHEKMNLDGKTYTVFSEQKLKGTSDAFVTPAVIEIKGFIMPKPQTVKIEPDGSTVITYQYERMKMKLTLTNEKFIESEFETGEYFFETVITLTALEREGYKFKKWSNGDTNTIIGFKLTSNTKIGPEYLPNKYNVKFDGNKATSGSMKPYYTYYDEHFTLPENEFKRLGYDFTGWNTQADGKGDHYNNVQKVSNLTTEGTIVLYAQWKARTDTPYKVEHWQMNLNGKGYTLFETEKFEGETDTEVEPDTKKYKGFTAPKTQKLKIEADGSTKFVYEYERNKYTLTIIDPANVNEGFTSSKFYYGTVITLSGKKITGYTLTHWTNGMTGEEISFELLDDMKIGPVYEANKYKIYFDANATKYVTGEMEPQEHTYDQKQKLTKNAFKRAGYDFVGWSRNKNANPEMMKMMPDEYTVKNLSTGDDITLYAHWVARNDTPYTVKYMLMTVDGKDYEEDKEARETLTGTTDTLVTGKVKTYEGFKSPKAQYKNLEGDGKMVIEYRYVREKRLLTITNEEYVVTEQHSGEYNYGTVITLTADKVPGYTFINWTDDNLTKEKTLSFELLKDTEVGPVYKANNYTIRFDGNGATSGEMSDIELTYDAEPTKLPENKFERAGYDYANKWNTEANGSGKSYDEGEKVKNVATEGTKILYAQWIARNDTPYKVNHVVENMDGTFSTTTIPMTGMTDTYVEPAVNTYEHHDSPAVQKKKITGDGLMEITYTYPLSKVKLILTDAQYIQTTTPTGEYKYGTTITLKAKKRFDDYYFSNWTNNETTEEISFALVEETKIGPVYAADNDFKVAFYKSGPCKFNGPHAAMDGEGCEDNPDEEGYIDTHIALFSQANLRKDFVVDFYVSGLTDIYSTTVKNGHEDYRPTLFNSTLEVAPGFPGVVVRRRDGTSDLMIGSNVVKNGHKISDMKLSVPMSSTNRVTLIRKNDNFCYAINGGTPVFVNNYTNHDAYFDQTAFFGASIEKGVIYRNLKGTMSNMQIKLGKDVHNRFTCEP